jgi:hypothetical protein
MRVIQRKGMGIKGRKGRKEGRRRKMTCPLPKKIPESATARI